MKYSKCEKCGRSFPLVHWNPVGEDTPHNNKQCVLCIRERVTRLQRKVWDKVATPDEMKEGVMLHAMLNPHV